MENKINETWTLTRKIEEYKSLMPWFVLEYYQSKLSVPYSFTTLYEYLKEYKRFFNWLIDSGISDADDIASIHIKTLENLTKKIWNRLSSIYVNVHL